MDAQKTAQNRATREERRSAERVSLSQQIEESERAARADEQTIAAAKGSIAAGQKALLTAKKTKKKNDATVKRLRSKLRKLT